uniref:Tripartite motif-containing protein 43-like n=1 Tax=Sus scrofa TaxID=9823 RepID=A0A8D1GCY0_PIG
MALSKTQLLHFSATLQFFQNEFTCSLCDKYFIDPVTLGCGHSFCMPCLCLSWEEEAQHPPRCPVCKEKSHQMNLKTNIVLMTRVFLARRTGPYDLPSPEEQTCETHMKPKNFYCEVTKDVLCLPCSKTKEHVAHLHCSIEWTAEEYRQKLLKQMRCLWVKIQQNERNLRRETSKIRNWEDYVTLWKKTVVSDYWKVCRLLDQEEKRYLQRLDEESKEIFQQLQESQYNMDLMGNLLRGLYEELKDLCHKPDMQMIQVRTEEWSEKLQLHVPQPIVPQLSSCPITGLMGWLEQFQGNRQPSGRAVHSPLLVSCGFSFPQLFHLLKYFLAWGAESFTSGQHYWEVNVAGCCNWAIGLCNDSWAKKNDMALESEGIFLLFCIQENQQCSLFTSSPLTPQYVQRPLGQVGVFLDHEAGLVSFIDVATSSLICSFLSCSFSSSLKAFLCSGHP